MAKSNPTTEYDCTNTRLWTVSRDDIEFAADRLYSLGVSNVLTISRRDQINLINASRIIRRLLQSYESASQRTLHSLLLNGGIE